MGLNILFLIVLLILILSGAGRHDAEHIPYALTGMDAWVYDDVNEKSYYAGRAKANYFSKQRAMDECGRMANAEARRNNLDDWSYVCCTVTSKTNCATKVR